MNINSYIARQFGRPTGLGGGIVAAVMNRQNQPLYEETERLLSPCNADRILDIGCGNGYVLRVLAERYDCDYVGIDISESILRAAAKRNRRSVRDGRMAFKCCEASRMVFGDAAFDKAFTINTVYFWEDLSSTMAEIRRVLKSGGTFINTLYANETLARFSHTQYGYKRFTQEQLTSAAQSAGFSTETVPILGGAAYCIVCHALRPVSPSRP